MVKRTFPLYHRRRPLCKQAGADLPLLLVKPAVPGSAADRNPDPPKAMAVMSVDGGSWIRPDTPCVGARGDIISVAEPRLRRARTGARQGWKEELANVQGFKNHEGDHTMPYDAVQTQTGKMQSHGESPVQGSYFRARRACGDAEKPIPVEGGAASLPVRRMRRMASDETARMAHEKR